MIVGACALISIGKIDAQFCGSDYCDVAVRADVL
jgi:hypothetical protein